MSAGAVVLRAIVPDDALPRSGERTVHDQGASIEAPGRSHVYLSLPKAWAKPYGKIRQWGVRHPVRGRLPLTPDSLHQDSRPTGDWPSYQRGRIHRVRLRHRAGLVRRWRIAITTTDSEAIVKKMPVHRELVGHIEDSVHAFRAGMDQTCVP
jgi:hypothetical protein